MNLELTAEVKEMLLKIEAYEAIGDLENRQRVINQLISVAPYAGLEAGYRLVDEDSTQISKPNWASDIIAFIKLPTGEVSYFTLQPTAPYAGYTREEKLLRISNFVNDKYERIGQFEDNEYVNDNK